MKELFSSNSSTPGNDVRVGGYSASWTVNESHVGVRNISSCPLHSVGGGGHSSLLLFQLVQLLFQFELSLLPT